MVEGARLPHRRIPMIHPLQRLFLAAALTATTAVGQFAPIPNSGCAGAQGVDGVGAPRLGQTIRLSCPNQGRSVAQLLLFGPCDLGGTALPAFLACPTVPCTVHVVLGRADSIDTGFQPIDLPIPNNPSLVGYQVCVQCAGFSVQPGVCFTVFGAATLTVQS